MMLWETLGSSQLYYNLHTVHLPPITALTRGLRSLNTVWAQHLSEEVKYRFYKN